MSPKDILAYGSGCTIGTVLGGFVMSTPGDIIAGEAFCVAWTVCFLAIVAKRSQAQPNTTARRAS